MSVFTLKREHLLLLLFFYVLEKQNLELGISKKYNFENLDWCSSLNWAVFSKKVNIILFCLFLLIIAVEMNSNGKKYACFVI